MNFLNIGGATGLLEHNGIRVLFDPWIDDPCWHGSWWHFPPSKITITDLGHIDYIYISHVHEDHCSYGTLKEINRDATIILMDKEPNVSFITKFLDNYNLAFKEIILVKPHSPKQLLPNFFVDMVTADPDHEYNYLIDSGLIINWDDIVIYNANDCPPYQGSIEYIRNNYGAVDFALLPYAPSSSYPQCFHNLSDQEKRSEKERLLDEGISKFKNNVEYLRPKRVLPFADQFVVGGSKKITNDYMPHPPGTALVKEKLAGTDIVDSILLLNSGQNYDIERGDLSPDEPYFVYTEDDRKKYIDKISENAIYDHEKFELDRGVPIERLLRLGVTRLFEIQKKNNYFPDWRYIVEIINRDCIFKVDLKVNEFSVVSNTNSLSAPYLKVSINDSLLVMLLIGHISWNGADAAQFIDYYREPNMYDPKVQAYLNYIRI